MNAIIEFLSLFHTSWVAPEGVFNGGAIVLVVMGALIGLTSVGDHDDPTDF